MARYIDAELFADRLLNAWTTADQEKKFEIVAILANIVTPILASTPTADVAPRAEVAREIFEEIITTIFETMPPNILLVGKDADFTDGVRFGKREAILDMINNLAELKKKYAEVQK